jgi:RNA polymerase sigma factor (sigma-70 family)
VKRSEPQEILAQTKTLVLQLQSGDEQALQPLMKRTHDRAYRLALAICRDRHLAEDVVQEAFLSVFRSIHQLREPLAFQTWLARIVDNKCRKVMGKRRSLILDQEERERAADKTSTDGLERRVAGRLNLNQAMEQLSEAHRQALTLREVMGYTYDEIADILQVPVGTVRSRLAGARRNLAAIIQGDS